MSHGQGQQNFRKMFLFGGHQYPHLLHVRVSEVRKWISNDTIAKRLTWYSSLFGQLNESFSSKVSFPNIHKKTADKHWFFQGINGFHLLHLWASGVKERMRCDTLAKRLTWYFGWFSQLNERFSSNTSQHHRQTNCYQVFMFLSTSLPFICSILELLRSRNRSGMTP